MGVISNVRDSTKTKLDAIQVANPLLLDHTASARPGAFGGVPMAYVGDTRMTLVHGSGIRRWSGEQDVVLVDMISDNEETMVCLAALADIVVDAFSDDAHAMGANTVSEPTTVGWIPQPISSTEYEAVVITVGKFTYQEGR